MRRRSLGSADCFVRTSSESDLEFNENLLNWQETARSYSSGLNAVQFLNKWRLSYCILEFAEKGGRTLGYSIFYEDGQFFSNSRISLEEAGNKLSGGDSLGATAAWLTCRSVSRLLVSRTRDLVASNSIFSFSWVSRRQPICVCAEPRFCSPSLTSSCRWDTCNTTAEWWVKLAADHHNHLPSPAIPEEDEQFRHQDT